jgi:hypothetical protein
MKFYSSDSFLVASCRRDMRLGPSGGSQPPVCRDELWRRTEDHVIGARYAELRRLGARERDRSIGLYVVSIPLAFVSPWISVTLYIAGALIWFVPDWRIESTART